jgi:hypothetical protein
MKWINIKDKNGSDFKRLVGIERETFDEMVIAVNKYIKKNCFDPNGCRPCKISIEEQVLITMIYWKEYNSMAYLGAIYGVHEATICRKIHKIENILSEHKKFKLPDKNKITKASIKGDVVIVDATEIRIERPKKNSKIFTQAKQVITH